MPKLKEILDNGLRFIYLMIVHSGTVWAHPDAEEKLRSQFL